MNINDRNIEETLSNFQEDLRKHGMSQNTIISYLCAVRHFFIHFPTLSVKNLQDYREFLMLHTVPATVNARTAAMNHFLAFFFRQSASSCDSILSEKSMSLFQRQSPFPMTTSFVPSGRSRNPTWIPSFPRKIMTV